MPGDSVTIEAPVFFNFVMTSSTRISGADAPAVKPIFSFPLNHSFLSSFEAQIRYAGTPAF